MVFLLMCFGVYFYILGQITGLGGVCEWVHVCWYYTQAVASIHWSRGRILQ